MSLSRSRLPSRARCVPPRSKSRSDSNAASSAAAARRAVLARREQHVREPRVRRELLHRAAVRA